MMTLSSVGQQYSHVKLKSANKITSFPLQFIGKFVAIAPKQAFPPFITNKTHELMELFLQAGSFSCLNLKT